ncbi:MAG: GDP-mannose 4,6-dehydratase [Acidobacteria bacterium]|nr:GDP-mannose 4,6-dehydratase [Acidobacteriota bacterium]
MSGRVVITGGAGFLGSHLCDLFLEKGFEVVCLDNLLTGNLDNIRHLRSRPEFLFVHHDVTNYIDVDGPVDYVLHFAPVSVLTGVLVGVASTTLVTRRPSAGRGFA